MAANARANALAAMQNQRNLMVNVLADIQKFVEDGGAEMQDVQNNVNDLDNEHRATIATLQGQLDTAVAANAAKDLTIANQGATLKANAVALSDKDAVIKGHVAVIAVKNGTIAALRVKNSGLRDELSTSQKDRKRKSKQGGILQGAIKRYLGAIAQHSLMGAVTMAQVVDEARRGYDSINRRNLPSGELALLLEAFEDVVEAGYEGRLTEADWVHIYQPL